MAVACMRTAPESSLRLRSAPRVMAAAKRLFLKAYGTFMIYACGAIALAGILLGLQLRCMNETQNSFVEEYCLSDNNMRAVVAAVLTVTVWLMWTALADVICSFRTARLSVGIQEGAYVALGSMNYKYCWRCLKTRWCARSTTASVPVLWARHVTNRTQCCGQDCTSVCEIALQRCHGL